MQQSDSTEASNTTTRRAARKRVSLSPHRAEIRGWVSEGRSDEWIANALGTSSSSVQSFRSRSGIMRKATSKQAETVPGEGASNAYEGVLEHGEEDGYGLWLDPAVADDPIFQKSFADVSDVSVSLESDRIVLTPVHRADAESTAGGADTVSDGAGGQLERLFGAGNLQEAARSASASTTEQGKVKWFDPEKGYGFIYRPAGWQIFVHKSEIKNGDKLEVGTQVTYEVGENERGPVAREVRPLQ